MTDETSSGQTLPASSSSATGRDVVNQLLGQAQMARTFGLFSTTVGTSKLCVVKENKLYQQLRGMQTPDGLRLSGTWEEFCGLLGVSVSKADEDIANLSAFGGEALDQMQKIGIGYRELRQFRRLPGNERVELIEAAKAGDKDSFVEIAETLISRTAEQKIQLEERIKDLSADLVSASVKIDTTVAERDAARAQLARQPGERDDHVPVVFADARAEIGVLQRKAAVSVESLHTVVRELQALGAGNKDAATWRDGTARLALAGMAELRMALNAAIVDLLAMLPDEGVVVPTSISRLTERETGEWAEHWRTLTSVHEFEREYRATTRHNAANAGKRGRPRDLPKAPAGTAAAKRGAK